MSTKNIFQYFIKVVKILKHFFFFSTRIGIARIEKSITEIVATKTSKF